MPTQRAVRLTRLVRLIAFLVVISGAWIATSAALAQASSTGSSGGDGPAEVNAKANPKVIADPEPRAYFTDFGDSSLDFTLRVWVEDFSDGYSTKSELSVAVQEALAQADIGVPFPQRDLHLVSVSPGVATELTSHSSPSPPPGTTSGSDDES